MNVNDISMQSDYYRPMEKEASPDDFLKRPFEIIEPSAKIVSMTENHIYTYLDKVASVCYGREAHPTTEAQAAFLGRLEKMGHHTIFEHFNVGVRFVTDRAIANCITRHRLMSFTQESTMYKAYRDKIRVVIPSYFIGANAKPGAAQAWRSGIHSACLQYHALLSNGVPQRVARSVLPLCAAAELYATANLRQWRHFFEMRCSDMDHDDTKLLVYPLFLEFERLLPEYFTPARETKGFYNG